MVVIPGMKKIITMIGVFLKLMRIRRHNMSDEGNDGKIESFFALLLLSLFT